MSRPLVLCLAIAASALSLTGCKSRDPYYRTDVWQPDGANAANLAAMVADPHDLIRGRGDNRVLAKEPAQAVEKLWAPADTGGGGAGSAGSGGGAGGGAGISLGGSSGASPSGG